MAFMSCLPKQDEAKNTRRYGTKKLPVILSEVQTGNNYSSTKPKYVSYQRARRKDAEPIIVSEITVIGSLLSLKINTAVHLLKNGITEDY